MPKNEVDAEDPMEMVGVFVSGDDRKMTECFIEEYTFLGYSPRQIFNLFRDPFYAGVYRVYEQRGEAFVKGLIEEVAGPIGALGREEQSHG